MVIAHETIAVCLHIFILFAWAEMVDLDCRQADWISMSEEQKTKEIYYGLHCFLFWKS